MKIILDIDETLCFVDPLLRETIKRREVKEAPWPIVLFGLLLLNPKIDPEMLTILNRLFNTAQIKVASERPVKTEKYTKCWLQKKGFSFHSVKCLGTEKEKKEYILSEKPDLVVDDDEKILSFFREKKYVANRPEEFKKNYYKKVARQF